MGLITKYGTIWGAVPNTAGRVMWVAPTSPYLVEGRAYDASDGNDGLSPERALATINRAATVLVTANAGDVVVMLPGTHVLTAAVTASTAGVTYMGLPSGAGNKIRQKTVVQASASAACFNITAADCELGYLHMAPTTANDAVTLAAGGTRTYIHHCSFDMYTPAASTSTLGINATGAASNVLIETCVFMSSGAQGAAVDLTATLDSIVSDCDFMQRGGVWAAALTIGAATNRCVVRRCMFQASGISVTMTAGIEGAGSTSSAAAFLAGNFFGAPANTGGLVLTPINGFGTSSAQIVENYRAIADITTSGTSSLIVLID